MWPSDAAILAIAKALIVQFEGFSAKPYLDQAGVPTIGYGTTEYPDGKKVSLQDAECTRSEALAWAEFEMAKKLGAIKSRVARSISPSAHQIAALLSFAYNEGLGALFSSTLFARFNAGDFDSAAQCFLDWDKAHVNGVMTVIPGLVARRKAEVECFQTADAPVNSLTV